MKEEGAGENSGRDTAVAGEHDHLIFRGDRNDDECFKAASRARHLP